MHTSPHTLHTYIATSGSDVFLVGVVVHTVAGHEVVSLAQHVEQMLALLPQVAVHAHQRPVRLRGMYVCM